MLDCELVLVRIVEASKPLPCHALLMLEPTEVVLVLLAGSDSRRGGVRSLSRRIRRCEKEATRTCRVGAAAEKTAMWTSGIQ